MRKLSLAVWLLLAVPCFGQYNGTVPVGTIVDIKFTSRTTTGAPTTLSGAPVIKAYKSNSTTTETTTGVSLSADFDGVTGLNNVRVDTSADATFYAAQSNIALVITTGTVSGTSVVGEVVAQFRMSADFSVQKGVAYPNFPVWMLSASGAAVIGITPTCQIQKDGGAFAASSNAVTEVANGKYLLSVTATELNANAWSILCTGTGAVPYRRDVTPQQ